MKNLELDFYKHFDGNTVLLTTLPDAIQHSTTAGDALRLVKQLSTNRDVHFNVNPRRTGLSPTLRSGDDDVDVLAAIVVDMDVAGPTHKETALPKTKDEAMAFLDSLPIKPSACVDSGYGIHGYYLFEPAVGLTDPDIRKRVKGILNGFGQMVTSEAAKRGWKQDNTFSLSHMFRAPGSLNHKLDPPVPCKVVLINGKRYTLDDFAPYFVEPQTIQSAVFETDPEQYGSAQRIMDRCPFVQKMLNDPDGVSEPEWKAMCDNISLVPDGPDLFHEWSSKYSRKKNEYGTKSLVRWISSASGQLKFAIRALPSLRRIRGSSMAAFKLALLPANTSRGRSLRTSREMALNSVGPSGRRQFSRNAWNWDQRRWTVCSTPSTRPKLRPVSQVKSNVILSRRSSSRSWTKEWISFVTILPSRWSRSNSP